jgi:hypothetical protein
MVTKVDIRRPKGFTNNCDVVLRTGFNIHLSMVKNCNGFTPDYTAWSQICVCPWARHQTRRWQRVEPREACNFWHWMCPWSRHQTQFMAIMGKSLTIDGDSFSHGVHFRLPSKATTLSVSLSKPPNLSASSLQWGSQHSKAYLLLEFLTTKSWRIQRFLNCQLNSRFGIKTTDNVHCISKSRVHDLTWIHQNMNTCEKLQYWVLVKISKEEHPESMWYFISLYKNFENGHLAKWQDTNGH